MPNRLFPDGALRWMTCLNKIRNAELKSAILVLSLLRFGISAAAQRDVAWVDKRVAGIQPTPDERKIDRIGWAQDIRTALALGKANDRPVFLFTHDGRMGTGRC